MRANKFRVWDNNTKKFLADVSQFTVKDLEAHDDRYVFMQYTGANDKNGKEIYEGDVMDADHPGEAKGIVVYEEGEFHLWSGRGTNLQECFDLPVLSKMFEVIGNIYESPDLIPPKELAEDKTAA